MKKSFTQRTPGVLCVPKRNLISHFIIIVSLLMVFNSCKKDDSELKVDKSTSLKKDEILYGKLLKAGFKAEDIKDVGDAFLVEGDLLFRKQITNMKYFDNYFNLDIKSNKEGTETKQWHTTALIESENVERIGIAPSILHGVAQNAATNWSSISNSKINFCAYNRFLRLF